MTYGGTPSDHREQLKLVLVAASPDAMVNNAAVSPRGRVFSSFPRWSDNPTPGVAEAMPDGTFRPYPGGAWNAWASGSPPERGLVAIHSIHADCSNHLWVVDLAVEGPRRSKYLSNVPTFAEAGIGNYPIGSPIWWGLHVPARTSVAIVNKISADVGQALRTAAVADFLEKQFLEPAPGTPEQFDAFTKEDRRRAGEIVSRFNVPKQ